MCKIVCISDTHMWGMPLKDFPEGDILVVAGDLTYRGTEAELQRAYNELIKHKEDSRYKKGYKEIIMTPGNHDWGFYKNELMFREMFQDVVVLINEDYHYYDEDSNQVIKFWGSPVCPPFGNWAFYESDERRRDLWSHIPDDVDVLITHGPPKRVLDEVEDWMGNIEHTGCPHLHNRILELDHLKLHVFGHIHEGHGKLENFQGKHFYNASIMDARYQPTNKPLVFEYPRED